MSILSRLKPPAGSKRKANRVGRGPGSGNGKTAGRGMNGQGSRSGTGGMAYFEGGQMPLQRRVPKRGFRNTLADKVVNINVGSLDVFDNGTEVTPALLKEKGLIKRSFDALKVLGDGDLSKKLTVKAHAFSASALAKIAKAGGKAEVVPRSASSTSKAASSTSKAASSTSKAASSTSKAASSKAAPSQSKAGKAS
jgi:large subunit ribosomal protein L15